MKKKIKFKFLTKLILGAGSSASAILLGLGQLNILPFFLVGNIQNFILLWMLAGVVLVQTSLLSLKEGLKLPTLRDPMTLVSYTISLMAFILGSLFLFQVELPLQLVGVAGFFYVSLGMVVVIEIFR